MPENNNMEPTKLQGKEKIVYHYCSIESMYGILNNKSFWLTFLESSNDSTELVLGEKIIKEAVQELRDEYPEHDDVYNKILSAPKDKNYIKFRPRFKYYGLSLVEDKDSLTHWERYANNSQGVCIGFNINFLEFYTEMDTRLGFDWLQSIPIIYKYPEQIKSAKSSIISKLNRLSETHKDFSKVEYLYSLIYYSTLQEIKPQYKHHGFESEKEYRIFLKEGEAEVSSKFMKSMIKNAPKKSKNLFKKLSENTIELADELNVLKSRKKYNTFKDGIRSYYSLNLSKLWSDVLIPEIVLGPKCFQNKKELKSFLKFCDLNKTKVTVSKVPLR
ncbi:DUF2971 domain-containing protein [Wenyingzhuangia sp. IMCC45467]